MCVRDITGVCVCVCVCKGTSLGGVFVRDITGGGHVCKVISLGGMCKGHHRGRVRKGHHRQVTAAIRTLRKQLKVKGSVGFAIMATAEGRGIIQLTQFCSCQVTLMISSGCFSGLCTFLCCVHWCLCLIVCLWAHWRSRWLPG